MGRRRHVGACGDRWQPTITVGVAAPSRNPSIMSFFPINNNQSSIFPLLLAHLRGNLGGKKWVGDPLRDSGTGLAYWRGRVVEESLHIWPCPPEHLEQRDYNREAHTSTDKRKNETTNNKDHWRTHPLPHPLRSTAPVEERRRGAAEIRDTRPTNYSNEEGGSLCYILRYHIFQ